MLFLVMVYVLFGMEVCEDMNEEEGMDIILFKKDEEVCWFFFNLFLFILIFKGNIYFLSY